MKKTTTFKVGYFSAYYRGLECLLDDIWPKVREAVPTAELHVYYGWESWLGLQGPDEFYTRMEKKFEEMRSQGVVVHGRVSHEELARAMKEVQVWAYPTEFPEIHCITALKAQEAGCYPVTTNVAALNETVQCGTKINTRCIYVDEYKQQKFAEAVIKALKEGLKGTPVEGVDWSDVAKSWDKVIKEKLDDRQQQEKR